MNKPARAPLIVSSPSETSPLNTSRPPLEAAVLRDRHALHERTFVDGSRSKDAVAEEMGEDAVRALTSGEDETEAERGDEDGELTLDDVVFVSEEAARAEEP